MGEGDTHVFWNFPWLKHDHEHDAGEAPEQEHGALEPAAMVAVVEPARATPAVTGVAGAES